MSDVNGALDTIKQEAKISSLKYNILDAQQDVLIASVEAIISLANGGMVPDNIKGHIKLAAEEMLQAAKRYQDAKKEIIDGE